MSHAQQPRLHLESHSCVSGKSFGNRGFHQHSLRLHPKLPWSAREVQQGPRKMPKLSLVKIRIAKRDMSVFITAVFSRDDSALQGYRASQLIHTKLGGLVLYEEPAA